MVKKTIVVFLYLLPIIFIFKNWFILPFISGHDFPYFFRETLADYSLFPSAWNPIGMGEETTNYGLGIFINFIITLFVNTFNLSWELVYKVFIFGLFIFLSIFSSTYFLSRVLERPTSFQFFLSALIFTVNTYILMVVDGGQVGVALAYAVAPLVLGTFIKLIDYLTSISHNFKFQISNFKFSIPAGLALAIQVMFDLRIAFVTIGILLFYAVYHYYFIKRFSIQHSIFYFLFSIFIVIGFHASWLLPIIIYRSHPAIDIVSSFSSVESLRFFSFATFPQSLSLLHPNWPENIFGKVGFMKPEFLVLPLLAYSSLLFLSSKFKVQSSKLQLKIKSFENNLTIEQFNNRTILFFAFLGILGAFLAKGANSPFGEVNAWLFQYFPGMSMFRDPTKWYLLIALSYSVLIPFSLYSISKWLKLKVTGSVILNSVQDPETSSGQRLRSRNPSASLRAGKFGMTISLLFLIFTILYLIFLIRPVFLNQLSGTFAKHEIPQEYILLKNFLHSQTNFSRTLWVPTQQRYNFYSYMHPSVSADTIFPATNSAEIISKLREERSREILSNFSIRYVIIPYDSFGEIFVDDRKYNEKEYLETIELIDEIDWLRKIEDFGKIKVYEVPDHKDHFWLEGRGSLSYTPVNPSVYKIDAVIEKPTRLVFTDSYNPHWVAIVDGKEISSKMTQFNVNSFLLEKTGKYSLTVYFSKEKYYEYGKIISLIFTALILLVLIYSRKKINV